MHDSLYIQPIILGGVLRRNILHIPRRVAEMCYYKKWEGVINIKQLNVANCLDNSYIQSSLNLQSKGFESTLTGCCISKCYLLE